MKKNDVLGVYRGLVGSSWSKAILWLLARFRDFERPEHAPRSPAGTHTCTVMYTRVPCMPRSRKREQRPEAGKKNVHIPGKNSCFE